MESVIVGVLSALIAGFAAWQAGERQVRIRNVTEERAKWRARVRELAVDLSGAGAGEPGAVDRAVVGLRLLLNPYDQLDREIVALLDGLQSDAPDRDQLARVVVRLQLVLKHDWERAKREASWTGQVADTFRRALGMTPRPTRPDYRAFSAWRQRNPIRLEDELPPR